MRLKMGNHDFWHQLDDDGRRAIGLWLQEHGIDLHAVFVVGVQLGEGQIVVTEIARNPDGTPLTDAGGWDFVLTERTYPSHRPPPVWV